MVSSKELSRESLLIDAVGSPSAKADAAGPGSPS